MFSREWFLDGPDNYDHESLCKDCCVKDQEKDDASEFCKEVIEQQFGVKNFNEDLLNNAFFELAAFFKLDDHMKICDMNKMVIKKA